MKKIFTITIIFIFLNCSSTSYKNIERNVTKPTFSGNVHSITGTLDVRLEVADKLVEGTGRRSFFSTPIIIITFPVGLGAVLFLSNLLADDNLQQEAYNDALTKANADGLFQILRKTEYERGFILDEEKLTVVARPIFYKPGPVYTAPPATTPGKR